MSTTVTIRRGGKKTEVIVNDETAKVVAGSIERSLTHNYTKNQFPPADPEVAEGLSKLVGAFKNIGGGKER